MANAPAAQQIKRSPYQEDQLRQLVTTLYANIHSSPGASSRGLRSAPACRSANTSASLTDARASFELFCVSTLEHRIAGRAAHRALFVRGFEPPSCRRKASI